MFNTTFSRGILIALSLALGIYLASATIAGSVIASLAHAEAGRQARLSADAATAHRLAADYKLVRAECRKLTSAERGACTRDTPQTQQRAARPRLAQPTENPDEISSRTSGTSGRLDVALYQAHRQLLP